jgi:hypothetical protein
MTNHNKRYLNFYPTVTELEICWFIGRKRHEITSKQGTERKQDPTQNGLQMSVDVKSTYTAGGNLNAVSWSVEKPCDFFVLTEIRASHVRIVGVIARDKFLRPENLTSVGRGEFYSVPQSALKSFDEKYYKETL